ncbi:MAG: S-methyl-5-thioribose-1-phosphate isomerase [Candidatus Fermentibacteraceae bacterium]|nr:S-methyl-5-thioribose-1-phosphate isomerase [Candidatus Fermentibacteraceae bacterium]
MRWTDGSLRLLDQRRLPRNEVYIDCRDVDTLAEAIRTLAVRGAPAIGIAAAYGCALAALTTPSNPGFRKEFLRKLSVLEGTRPTAVNLFHCIDRQKVVYDNLGSGEDPAEALLRSAHLMREEDLDASRAMGRFGAELLKPGCSVLTHCNAGGLATAGLGTALAVIYEAWDRGMLKKVYADETRPLLQGSRLTSWELTRAGIPVDVLPDSAAASLLRSGRVDAVIVGSDRVAANGDAANKIGTYPIALAAAAHGVPFYVVAPLSTFDPGTARGEDIAIEQRGRGELAVSGGSVLLPEEAGIWNPAFDVTPASLITALICEKGVISSPDGRSVETMIRGKSDA